MNFFSKLTATTLAAIATVGIAFPANAGHPDQQPFVKAETELLLRAAISVGVRVFVDDPKLCTPGIMGMANDQKQLLICVKNHGTDSAELADTIRHELLHTVQYCLGNRLILPDRVKETRSYAQTELGWDILGYPVETWDQEGEARTLAHFLDESDVAELLRTNCK